MSRLQVLQSMTGFGSREVNIAPFGIMRVELKSINHKALEIVIHLPEGFAALDNNIKKTIETKMQRGRITCSISAQGAEFKRIHINRELVKDYLSALQEIKEEFKFNDIITLDALLHLPGVLSLSEQKIDTSHIWQRLKPLLERATDDLVKMRRKEGSAVYNFLLTRVRELEGKLSAIKIRFKKATADKLAKIKIDDERISFLKDSDITEEMERLTFHTKTFKSGLQKKGPMGKELDFIAQEMQREANTMAAKSFDIVISGRIIHIKSLIEKLREQLQNVE